MLTSRIATGGRPLAGSLREVNAWRDDRGVVFARGYTLDDHHLIVWPNLGTFRFRPGSLVVDVWLDDAARHAEARDALERVLQPMLLEALGWQALHASAVRLAEHDTVLAFCGLSGHGKSTIAFALAQRGHAQFADDAVVLDIGPSGVRALPLPFTPRLRPESARHFAATGGEPTVEPSPASVRGVVILEQRQDQVCAREKPPGRVEATIVPPVSAFAALVTHAHCFDPTNAAASKRLVQRYLDLAEQLPVWRLRYPAGLEHLDAVCHAVLKVALAPESPSG